MSSSVAIWNLWKERNNRIFKQISHSKVEVFNKIKEDVKILMKTCSWKLEGDPLQQQILSTGIFWTHKSHLMYQKYP